MDDRHGDVVVVRPMREYTAKEVAFYNRLFSVPTVFMPALDTKVVGLWSSAALSRLFCCLWHGGWHGHVTSIPGV